MPAAVSARFLNGTNPALSSRKSTGLPRLTSSASADWTLEGESRSSSSGVKTCFLVSAAS